MNTVDIRKQARIYAKLQLMQLRSAIEYAADFWIGIVGAMLMQSTGLIFISAIFSQVPNVAGWSAWNIALLYGLAMLPKGLIELFCDGPWTLRMKVSSGEFDRVLVRPVSPALQSATAIVSIHGLGQMILGAIMIWLGLANSEAAFHWWTVPYLILAVASGAIIIGAVTFAVNLTGFWEPNAQSAIPSMVGTMIDFAKFPLDIYSGIVRTVIAFVIPYAFLTYFPALVLLNHHSPWRWLGFCTPLMALWTVLITRAIWSKALNRYQGVGH